MVAALFVCAAVLAAVFGALMVARYRHRPRAFYAWWAVSFAAYVAAFLMEALSFAHNWHVLWQYQCYIVASAALVGCMAVGTGYLALPARWARGYAVLMAALSLALLGSVALDPPTLHGSWAALDAGAGIRGITQAVYVVISAGGGTMVVAGALWSWWRTRRLHNLLIAAGASMSSLAGVVASQGMGSLAFPVVNVVALAVIFAGYLSSQAVVVVGARQATMS